MAVEKSSSFFVSTGNACGTSVCTHGSQCMTDLNGNKSCACHMCSSIYSPVCGSDGKTYPNECHMGMISCRERRTITLKHDGNCGKNQLIICVGHVGLLDREQMTKGLFLYNCKDHKHLFAKFYVPKSIFVAF